MRKRQLLEEKFNTLLREHELLIKFRGNNEITIIGAPTNNIVPRLFLSIVGVILVTFCLKTSGDMNNTVTIEGALLGIIFTATPFISFYSKKYFKVMFSKQTQQMNITNSANGPYRRIDFSSIDYFLFKRFEVDDFVSPDIEIPVTYNYVFLAVCGTKEKELFTIDSKDKSIEKFTNMFSDFMVNFSGKSVKH